MFRNVKKAESNITVDLEEPLTAESCSQLIIEIIKYIMYQKQQIPFSGDTLKKLYDSTKPTDRNYSSMNKLISTLESISTQLTNELKLEECDIKGIIILIGATIVSPKLFIKLDLPNILNKTHIQREHSYRKPLLTIMRSILECTEFQDELTIPILPTNTFILVQKRDPNKTSEFFIPKPQFAVTSNKVACLNIRLNFNENQIPSCECNNLQPKFRVWFESLKTRSRSEEYKTRLYTEEDGKMKKARHSESDVPYLWYQSKEVFKGFKFVK